MYTATTVTVQRPNGNVEEYRCSLGGGAISDDYRYMHALLVQYAADEMNSLVEIRKVQDFLSCAGYGLSNVILKDVSEMYVNEA